LSKLATGTMTPEQRKSNLRLALILVSVAFVLFFGFMAKMMYLGG